MEDTILLKAAVTAATDQGTFEAVVSTASVDREKDIVDPQGFVRALQKWLPTGKLIPLSWNHSLAAEDIIGHVDPASAHVVGNDVVVSGYVDRSTPRGKEAWRLVKSRTLGFSFGYLTLDSSPRKGGGRHLKEMDVFEVTATPAPMNGETRVLGWKAMTQDQQVRVLNSMIGQAREFIASEPDQPDIDRMNQIVRLLTELGAEEAAEGPEDAEDASKSLPDTPEVPEDAATEPETAASGEKSAVAAQEPKAARVADPLEAKARRLALEVLTGGLSEQPPRKAVEEQPKPGPVMEPDELREYSRQIMVQALTGVET